MRARKGRESGRKREGERGERVRAREAGREGEGGLIGCGASYGGSDRAKEVVGPGQE